MANSPDNTANETIDYVRKVTVCSFVTFLHYFCLTDPYKNTKDLNEALDYDIAHMDTIQTLLRKKSQQELMIALGTALKLDPEIIYPWIGTQWTPEMTTAAYCASVVCMKHINPLVVTIRDSPGMYHDFMCVYNRIWRMGKMSPERDMCCDNSRLLYSLRMFATAHEEVATPYDLVIKLRMLLQLPSVAPLLHSQPETDYATIFRNMKINNLR